MGGTIARIGVVLVVAGALLLAGPAFGFGSMAADRGVSVTADEGPGALLGVDSETDVGELRGDDDPVRVATLFNNIGEDVDVIDVHIHNDGGVLAVNAPSPGTTVASGDSQNVTIQCAESTSLGTRTITVEIVEVEGATVSIGGVSFDVTVDVQCNKGGGSGVVDFRADDVGVADTSQTFSFSGDGLKNRDTAYVDLSDPQTNGGVDYTNASPTLVSGAGTVSYDPTQNRIAYTASGNVKGTVEIRMDGVDVVGDPGDRYTVTYAEDRRNAPNRTDSDIFYITE